MKDMQKSSLVIFIRFWLPVILWMAVIFSFSSLPTGTTTEIIWWDFIIKKTAHVVEYAILSFLLYRALVNSGVSKNKAGIWAIFLCVLYGLSDEYHQSFTPGRTPKLRDVGFDTIGATGIIYIVWNLLPIMPTRLKALAEKLQVV